MRPCFEDNCVYCYRPGRRPFRTPPQDVPAVLQRNRISAYRFDLSDAQLAELAEYLDALGTQP